MTPEKKNTIFSGLVALLALFFITPVKANVPATETNTTYGYCSSVSPYGQGPDSAPLVDGAGARADCLSMTVQSATYNGHACTATGTGTLGSQMKAQGYFEGGYHCPTYTTDPYLFLLVANYIEYTQTEYTCDDPSYPTLNGTTCVSNNQPPPEGYCQTQSAHFGVTNLPSLCVTTDTNTGYSCSYQAIEDPFGAHSGTFLPTGSSCECADSPDGQCYTPQEPPFPDGEECGVFGNYLWCSSDPSQCEATTGEGGGTIPCGNCGTVNDTFMCIAGDAPDAERCAASDPRPECIGTIEGDCPTGYQCDPLEANTDDTENRDQPTCILNDPRPECLGVSEGEAPTQSEETAQLSQLNDQVDDLRDGIGELNKTAKEIRERQLGEEDLPAIESGIQSLESQYQTDLTNAINDTTQQDTFIDGITAQFNGSTGTLSGSLLPTLGCAPLNITIPDGGTLNVPICETGDLVRPILAWIFALLTVTRLFSIIYQTLARSND